MARCRGKKGGSEKEKMKLNNFLRLMVLIITVLQTIGQLWAPSYIGGALLGFLICFNFLIAEISSNQELRKNDHKWFNRVVENIIKRVNRIDKESQQTIIKLQKDAAELAVENIELKRKLSRKRK